MRTDDLVGALWLPVDGKVNPADVDAGAGAGARASAARASSSRRAVTAIHRKDGVGRPASPPARGDIKAEVVVNCAGQWAQARSGACAA